MSTKKLLVLYGVLIILGVAAVFFFGMKPRPVEKIKLSQFEDSQVASKAVLLTLMRELKETPILIIGIDPQEKFQHEIVLQLWTAGQYDGMLIDETIPKSAGFVGEVFNLKNDTDRFFSGIQSVLDKKLRLLVVMPTYESSQMVAASLAFQLKKKYAHPIFSSITFSNFPRSREQEGNLTIPCNTGEQDQAGAADVGCLLLLKARGLYRKKLESGKWIGFLDQIGTTDFVFALQREK
jgi:hypothetical protein